METNKKQLDQSYTINLTKEQADMLERIAEHEQRKPRELLRLLIVPCLRAKWVEIQRAEHPQNKEPMQQAIFRD